MNIKMHKESTKFVSYFKIDGVPIIPPLMTDDVRFKMRQYKKLAVAKEIQINSNRNVKPQKLPLASNPNDMTSNLETLRINTNSQMPCDKTKVPLTNSSIDTSTETNYEKDVSIEIEEINSQYMQISSMIISSPPAEHVEDLVQSGDSGVGVDSHSKELQKESLAKRNSMPMSKSFEHDEAEPRKLIRSNSYTLDTPSPLFLKHLQEKQALTADQTIINTDEGRPEVQVQPNPLPVIDVKTKLLINNKLSPKSVPLRKSKKPLFDHVYGAKMKIYGGSSAKRTISTTNVSTKKDNTEPSKPTPKLNKTKLFSKNTPSSAQRKVRSSSSYTPQRTPGSVDIPSLNVVPVQNDKQIMDFIIKVEEERKIQMGLLLARQEEEQRKMAETFKKQQELLFKQITENCSNLLNIYQTDEDASPTISSNSTPLTSTPNRTINCNENPENNGVNTTWCETETPTNHTLIIIDNNNDAGSNVSDKTWTAEAELTEPICNITKSCKKQLFKESRALVESKAVTKINAWARGYLVRRLFKTEEVQEIVKVIRDTLIFVIDLHQERGAADDSTMNTLKRSLLKQLNSACNSLHSIFFVKTTKEKMQIISNDRTLLRSQLQKQSQILLSNRSSSSIDTYRTSSSKSLNKLSKLSLFSVNIAGVKGNHDNAKRNVSKKVSKSQTSLTSINSSSSSSNIISKTISKNKRSLPVRPKSSI